MSKCITKNNRYCPYLKFNDKGNLNFHCHYNIVNFGDTRPVQVCEDDLRREINCPINIHGPHIVANRGSN